MRSAGISHLFYSVCYSATLPGKGIYVEIEAKISGKRRIVFLRNACFVLLGLLCLVLVYRMLYKGEEYQKMAIEQQTSDSSISAKRGTIYDRNGKALAVSASVEQVIADPLVVKDSKNVEKIASKLAEVLELEYEEVYEKLTVNSRYVSIKRQIDKEVGNKVRELDLPGISVTEDSKRYYPYGAFAAQIIGFTGSDNQGLDGIEMEYDEQLKGIPGRIVSASSANEYLSSNSWRTCCIIHRPIMFFWKRNAPSILPSFEYPVSRAFPSVCA